MSKHKNQIDMESDLPIVSTVETRYARYDYTTICTSIYHLSTIFTTIHILFTYYLRALQFTYSTVLSKNIHKHDPLAIPLGIQQTQRCG